MINKELCQKIINAANKIHESQLNKSDYIIVSPKIAEAIENLDIKKLRKKKLNQIFKK